MTLTDTQIGTLRGSASASFGALTGDPCFNDLQISRTCCCWGGDAIWPLLEGRRRNSLEDAVTSPPYVAVSSGSSYYDNVRPLAYPDSDAVLICFDISRPETLDSVIKKVRAFSDGFDLELDHWASVDGDCLCRRSAACFFTPRQGRLRVAPLFIPPEFSWILDPAHIFGGEIKAGRC